MIIKTVTCDSCGERMEHTGFSTLYFEISLPEGLGAATARRHRVQVTVADDGLGGFTRKDICKCCLNTAVRKALL